MSVIYCKLPTLQLAVGLRLLRVRLVNLLDAVLVELQDRYMEREETQTQEYWDNKD